MKLFDNFEAVKFPEENCIFVTKDRYLYYVYYKKHWHKHPNAGNDEITLENYPDVSKEELIASLNGKFPTKETDFIRACFLSGSSCGGIPALLAEDYPDYIIEFNGIDYAVRTFLYESEICNVYDWNYSRLRKVLDDAVALKLNKKEVINQIKNLGIKLFGRDIFKREIEIVDGHDSSSYFWIMPSRITDHVDTTRFGTVAKLYCVEISIDEGDVDRYLVPFLLKHFDNNLEANKNRIKYHCVDDDGNKQPVYYTVFEWNLTDNFYTFDSVRKILCDINDTIDALQSGRENEFTGRLRKDIAFNVMYPMESEYERQIDENNTNTPSSTEKETELIIDFYKRFIYRIEYMMKVGKEKGYNLISFMGP